MTSNWIGKAKQEAENEKNILLAQEQQAMVFLKSQTETIFQKFTKIVHELQEAGYTADVVYEFTPFIESPPKNYKFHTTTHVVKVDMTDGTGPILGIDRNAYYCLRFFIGQVKTEPFFLETNRNGRLIQFITCYPVEIFITMVIDLDGETATKSSGPNQAQRRFISRLIESNHCLHYIHKKYGKVIEDGFVDEIYSKNLLSNIQSLFTDYLKEAM